MVSSPCSGITARPTSARPPYPCFPPLHGSASAGCRTTGPATAARPAYSGRDIASAAADVARIADALSINRFAVMGHSGGGVHALACGALLRERVVGVVSVAGLAPFGAVGLDWFAGMAASGVASLRAAAEGREAKERYEEASGDTYDPEFTPRDQAALSGTWSWLGTVVGPAVEAGRGGLIDDDLAYVAPWGVNPAQVVAPVLLLHGGRDRVVPSAHSAWLARRCPGAELRLLPDDGHISVLDSAAAALGWLREQADHG